MQVTPAVLFVCLGNICRSPLAEAAFRHAALEAGIEAIADSAGTGDWHAGEAPDRRAIVVAARHGIDITGLRARQVIPGDFIRFTHVLALDRDNLANLRRLRPQGANAQLALLNDFVPGREGQPVADPYYGDESGFVLTWREVSEAAQRLVAHFARGHFTPD